jgi:type II restriction/modification system DNA methylase subunit YeeA
MNATEFVKKWAASTGRERATAQEHFIDLCQLLGEQTPNEADPAGSDYAFEKGAKGRDGDGFADVWLNHHFAWEYKGKKKDLAAAYGQVLRYHEALGHPPLLVVCDLDRYEVHTKWTNTEGWIYRFRNADIASDDLVAVETISGAPVKDPPEFTARQVLKHLFDNRDALKPGRTRDEITREAAGLFEEVSEALRAVGTPDMEVAHFITRLVFCMFASDVGLLPPGTFSEVVQQSNPARMRREGRSGDPAPGFKKHLARLFDTMRTGGEIFVHQVPYFNGSLFDDDNVPAGLTAQEIQIVEKLDALDWSNVEPSIFGTLFERILDRQNKRAALGAHYTSRADIELIVEPVLMEPLRREWNAIKASVDEIQGKRLGEEARRERIKKLLAPFQKHLASVRVLDPACGSGNFLYVSLAALKALEKEVIALAEWHGIKIRPKVHPRQLYGIELNPYAHQLASVVIWIGYLQWKKENGLPLTDETPILEALRQIELKDAIVDEGSLTPGPSPTEGRGGKAARAVVDEGSLSADPSPTDGRGGKAARPKEATWPEVDVIAGNPPFLGGKRLRTELGDAYVDKMFAVYEGRVARESDLVCYWFEKARAQIEAGKAKRAGLLATQAIRGGANRKALERIKETGDIFYAQADRRWILEGAAVQVSMVGFDDGSETRRLLNADKDDEPHHALLRAQLVPEIHANLTGGAANVTEAQRLKENNGISFMGDTKVGDFDIPAHFARKLLAEHNPHGKPNSDVVRPWMNGLDITRRSRNMWIVDFPPGMSEADAAKYEAPFEHIKKVVRPFRAKAKSGDATGVPWWIHQRPRPDMRGALAGLNRYIATPNLTKYRFFVWLSSEVLPDHQLIVFARADDYFFGVLHSRAHEVWARSQGTQLREVESGFRYTPTTCFETFPFPRATQKQQWAIAIAAKDLNDLREGWLNPEGMIGAKELAKRTLTNLYNAKPQWLRDAHRKLDEAVFAAYGWREDPDRLPEEEILSRLLKLNLEREPV